MKNMLLEMISKNSLNYMHFFQQPLVQVSSHSSNLKIGWFLFKKKNLARTKRNPNENIRKYDLF